MPQHEGWYLKANVDIAGLLSANQQAESLYKNLLKVDAGVSKMRGNDALAKSIKSTDLASASLIEKLKVQGKEYESDQEKAKLLTRQIEQLNSREKGLVRQLEEIEKASGKNSDAYNIQKVRINQTSTAITHFKNDLKSTQAEMDRLRPTGFNRIVKDANKVVSAGNKVKSALHNTWNSVKSGAIAGGAAVAGMGAAAMHGAKIAGNLQQRYREITNLATLGGEKSREVTKSVAEMQQQARDIAIKYGKSQVEIAEGYEDLVKRGYTTKQALGAMTAEVQASIASGDKFSDVTTVSSQVLDAFNLRSSKTATMLRNTNKVVNELAYSADATSTGFNDIGVAMSYVGTVAHSNNISLAETAAALGVLSNNGLESDKAGTGLRATINGITGAIKKIGSKGDVLTPLGLGKKDLLDSKGNLKDLSTVMGTLYKHINEHYKGGSDRNNVYRAIFGTTAMNAAQILARDSAEVEKLTIRTEKAGKTGDYVAKLAQKNMATYQGNAARAKQATQDFEIAIGTRMLPAMTEAQNELSKFLLSNDGKKFEKNVGGAVSNVTKSLINLIRFMEQHPALTKGIGMTVVGGWTVYKGAQFVKFLGEVKTAYKGISESSKALQGVNTFAKLQKNPIKNWSSLGKVGKLTVAANAAFDAVQIGSDFYRAVKTAKSPGAKAGAYGSGVGGIIGGVVGASLGGSVGATIGVEFGRKMGQEAGPAFLKAFTTFPKTKAHGLTWLDGKLVRGWSENGIYSYDKKGNLKFTDLRNAAEKKWNTGHIGDTSRMSHAQTLEDFVAGTVKYDWGVITHLADRDWWRRSAKAQKDMNRGTAWGGMIDGIHNGIAGVGSWINKHQVKNDAKTSSDIMRGITKNVAGWLNPKFPKMGKLDIDWGGFGTAGKQIKDFFDFSPKIHGKKPKHWKLQRAEIIPNLKLPKINGKKWSKDLQRDIKSGWSGFNTWNSKLGKESSNFFKKHWSGLQSWANKRKRDTQNGWNGTKAWFGKLGHNSSLFFKSEWGGLTSWASKRQKDVQNGWNGSKRWFGKLGQGLVDNLKKPFEGIGQWFGKQWKNITDEASKIKSGAQGVWNKLTGHGKGKGIKSHAVGGWIGASHSALVGEAGPELAYKNGTARLLGANGPQFTKVHAGEHILNARDTAKVFSGGLGQGYKLKGYATGTDKLQKTSQNVTRDYKHIHDTSSKSLKDLSRVNRSVWKKIASQTDKQTTKTRKNAISDYTSTRVGVTKQMRKMHSGVIDLAQSTSTGFGKELNNMHKYAHTAMSNTIGELNGGIRSIDKVLSQFGGNSAVIKPVHFAKGTDENGRLTRSTFAMINDADSGPRQEALVSPENKLYLPKGDNLQLMIPAGWGVLNGTQTQQVRKGVTHFAKGTGISKQHLQKVAEQNQAHPAKWFEDTFTNGIKSALPEIQKGSTDLAKNASMQYGNPWSSAMWNVINNAIDSAGGKGGTREAFLKYAESTFTGVPYQMGAASKALSDCSGMVSQALKHFGINIGRTTVAMQNSTGVQYLGKSLSKTLPGDLVIFGHGTGAAGHVGIIKNPKTGTMFNETPPRARVTRISDDMSMGYGYYRVRGLHNKKATKAQKSNSRLEALAKRELGSSALKWISNNLADTDTSGIQAGKATGDHEHWMKQAHIPEKYWNDINWIVQSESGWNPRAVNPSSGTYGLGQMQGYNLHYYTSHGSKNNPIAQLMGIMDYIKERYGTVERAVSFRRARNWYSKGGTHRTSTPFIAGENGPELITADHPVHIDSHEQTKNKARKLNSLINGTKTPQKGLSRGIGNQPITININITGPISSRRDAQEYGDIIKDKIGQEIYNLFGQEFGSDPSIS